MTPQKAVAAVQPPKVSPKGPKKTVTKKADSHGAKVHPCKNCPLAKEGKP